MRSAAKLGVDNSTVSSTHTASKLAMDQCESTKWRWNATIALTLEKNDNHTMSSYLWTAKLVYRETSPPKMPLADKGNILSVYWLIKRSV